MNNEQPRAGTSHNGGGVPQPMGLHGFQYSSGAFQPPQSSAKAAPVKSATPPKQPRGRFFVVFMVFSVLAYGGYSVFEAFLHYAAYGVIAGRNIQVPATVDGVVQFVHVEEGETVRQGQLLLTLHSPDLDQRMARLDDNLRLAQAKLQAAVSRMKWELSERELATEESVAEFYEKWGLARREQVRLVEFQQTLKRTEELYAKKIVPLQDLQRARSDEQGLRENVEKLVAGLEARKRRVESGRAGGLSRRDELLPLMAEIESMEGEQHRLRTDQDRQLIRSPVNGIVAKRHRFTGEGAAYLQTLFTIIEENSLHVELFVSQDRLTSFRVGDEIDVQLAPFWELVPCRLVRFGDEHVRPPAQIDRFYPHQSTHLPLILEPIAESLKHDRIQLGAVVRLPHSPLPWPQQRSQQRSQSEPAPTEAVAIIPDPLDGFH